MERKIHHIKITNNDSNTNRYFSIDCIDIDEDGYMIYCDDNGKLYYDMTPIMTSNTSPAPYVASGNISSKYYPYKAFDGKSVVGGINNIQEGFVTDGICGDIILDMGNKNKISNFILQCNPINISNKNSQPKDFEIYGSNDGETFELIRAFTNEINWSANAIETRLYSLLNTNNYRYYKFNISNNNGGNYTAFSELRYLLAVDTTFFLINDNGVYKNYDEETNSLIEVSDISILKEDPLNNQCICNLNYIGNLIDLRQDGIKVISNQNVKSIANSIKADKQLILANNDFSTRIADNIDYFKSEYSLSDENCVIKTVISIDSGVTWYSYIDGVWAQLVNTVACKTYEELSDSEKQQWATFLDEVLEKGINISNIETLDFNLLNSEKIRFVYAIQIEDGNSEAILKNIKWQFDSIGTYEQMSPKDEVNIAMTNNEIKIQPLKDVELMKINVGITSQVPQDFDTSGLLDKETFKGKEINRVKKADIAKELENLSKDNVNKLLQILSFINGSNPQQYLGTNIDNELGMHYLPTNSGTTNGNSIEQRVVLNVKSGDIIPVETVADMQDQKAFIQVFKFEEGDQDVISTLKEFNNTNEDNFIYNSDNVSFDDTCHIKNKYTLSSTLNSDTELYETKFNKSEFLNIQSMSSEVNN